MHQQASSGYPLTVYYAFKQSETDSVTCDEDDDEIPVHLMPYVDIFEGYAYHDREYIYLSVDKDKPSKTYYVDPFEASGYNER